MNEKHLVVLEFVALLVEISSVVGYCCIFFFFFFWVKISHGSKKERKNSIPEKGRSKNR